MPIDKNLMTAQALAEALDLSAETIWKYTREKKIPFIELNGKQYRYILTDVIHALTNTASAVQEKSNEYTAESSRKLTYEDYLKIPDEPGYRIEILEGIMVKEPSPNVSHQHVLLRLTWILEDYFRGNDPEGEVFVAPLDVTLLDINVVQPDIFYVSGQQKQIIKEARINGQPTIVVEIISPSSRRKDRLQKLQIYQKTKIPHYWLVDPAEKTLECFVLRDGSYVLAAAGMDEDVVDLPYFTGLSIPLKSLW